MFATRRGRWIARTAAGACVLALLIVGVLWWENHAAGSKRITAYFDEAVGVYAGSDLRVLGVTVGTIDAVLPVGQQVKVIMTLDPGISVPVNANAMVIAPSVVSDRYVQLSPPYTGGPQITDGATIPASRTATPIELDQLYQSLNRLAAELGPNGANSTGAVSDLLNVAAKNLAGNGGTLGDTINQLGAAARTLSGSQHNLFGTVDNLQQFTSMLARNDGQLRTAEQQLAQVSGFLAADRESLGAALNDMATALGQVQSFIQNNRARIKSNVDKLANISQVLVNQRNSLAELLDDAPLAVTNLLNAYDPATRTLNGRADLNEFSMASGAPAGMAPVSQPDQAGLPPLPLPATGTVFATPIGGNR